MPYPILPLIFTWGTSYQHEERVNSSRYEDGVELFERAGINRRSQSIDVAINIVNPDSVDAFLRERRGQPFRLQTLNRLQGEDLLFSCSEWELPEVSRGCWLFKAKLVQVRRFEQKTVQFISLSSDNLIVPAGENAILTAGVSGFSLFPELSWSVIAGEGSVSSTIFNQAQYTLPLNGSAGIVRIRCQIVDTNLSEIIELRTIAASSVLSVTVSPRSLARSGGTQPLTATVQRTGAAVNGVNWSVVAGMAVLNNIRPLTVDILMLNVAQEVRIRATAVSDTSKWDESVISIQQPPIISSIQATVNPTTVAQNGTAQLTAQITGTGAFNPAIQWTILSGGGLITGSQYTAGPNDGPVVLQAASVGNPLVKIEVSLLVQSDPVVSTVVATAVPATTNPGDAVQLNALVSGTVGISQLVNWSIISGSATLTGNSLTVNSTATQNIVVRATSQQDPTKYGEVEIQVQPQAVVTGITATADPIVLVNTFAQSPPTTQLSAIVSGTGSVSQNVNWSIIQGNGVLNGNIFTFNGYDSEKVTIRASSQQNPLIYVDLDIQVWLANFSWTEWTIWTRVSSLEIADSLQNSFVANQVRDKIISQISPSDPIPFPFGNNSPLMEIQYEIYTILVYYYWSGVSITTVSVTSQDPVVNAGLGTQLYAVVQGVGSISQNVVWSIISGNATLTDNNLLVSASATQNVVVRATSQQDPTKYGEVEIQVVVAPIEPIPGPGDSWFIAANRTWIIEPPTVNNFLTSWMVWTTVNGEEMANALTAPALRSQIQQGLESTLGSSFSELPEGDSPLIYTDNNGFIERIAFFYQPI